VNKWLDMTRNRILITGATGFIGSHLVELCLEQGLDVVAFDRYNPTNHWGWLEDTNYKHEIEVILGDVRDYDSVAKAMFGCESVIHLAALIGIPYSYLSPLAYVRTNVEGTYNILEAAKNLSIKNILITSTSETYGTAQYVPMDESHPVVGQSPYAASKIGADQLAISYHRSFDLPVTIVRPFNTYGPRQSARAVIPTIVAQCLRSGGSIKLGDLAPTRDLTFVRDTCRGFLEIFSSDSLFGEIVNIGMNEEISVGELAKTIAGLMGKTVDIDCDSKRLRPLASEVKQLRCDNSKLLEFTKWEPEYNLERGLLETIQWFTGSAHLYKPEIYNV
tara:strand:- start:12167 stop:13165 length:999 start_codon:yes stop_codon:yes gene_type:complete